MSVDEQRRYWDDFYKSARSADVPPDPSAFAAWTQERLSDEQLVIEFGFGTARDALWFLRQGHAVRGYDFANSAVDAANQHAEALPGDASFAVLDLSDTSAVNAAVADLSTHEAAPAVYGRFLIHSLTDVGRTNLFDVASGLGAELFVEFRTGKDKGMKHIFGDDHYRTYLDPESVVIEIEERGGRVTTLDQGHGRAVYKSEDPHVARVLADFAK